MEIRIDAFAEATPLPEATRLGPAVLQVTDLNRTVAFYEQVLGLRVLARDDAQASLGADSATEPLLVLRGGAMRPAGRGRLGLFHFAFLLPDRGALGRFVRHLAGLGIRAGAGDHLVSEAFYLDDPDGLGIEVYADRPRDSWRRVGGELVMGTEAVDVEGLVAAAGPMPWVGMPAGTVMGHLHLHVGTLEAASAFYHEALGFDRMVWSYPGALFLGAGGYHHHLGTTVWAGPTARPAAADEARLLEWTIVLPSTHALDAVATRLARAGAVLTRDVVAGDVVTRDPWGTALRLSALY
ncbi:MAG: VOC family protein [Gemmatimonadota bacterium]